MLTLSADFMDVLGNMDIIGKLLLEWRRLHECGSDRVEDMKVSISVTLKLTPSLVELGLFADTNNSFLYFLIFTILN